MLKLPDGLGEYSFQGFPGQRIAWIFGEFFPAELKIMIVVKFPELDIDDIKIFIAKKIWISIDIWFILDIDETLVYAWVLEFSIGHLVIVFYVWHVVHSVDHAERVPFLELGGLLQELETRVALQDLLE